MGKSIALKEFRRNASISQSDLARLLRTTKTQIYRAEKGERPLSGKATGRLDKMKSMSLNEIEIPAEEENYMDSAESDIKASIVNTFRARSADAQWQSYQKGKLLQKMKEEETDIMVLCRSLWGIMKVLEEDNAASQEKAFFKDKLYTVYKKLAACGKTAQLKLQVEIDLLTAEASVLNQYLGETTVAPGVPM